MAGFPHTDLLLEELRKRKTIDHTLADELIGRWIKKKRIDEEGRVKIMQKKADEGDTEAMYSLGKWLEDGENGLEEDEDAAYQWFKKAADGGHVDGMAWAGYFQVYGHGSVDRNIGGGLVLLVLAAERGSKFAQHLLGEFYHKGMHGIAKDAKNAKYWLEKVLKNTGTEIHRDYVEECRDWLREIEEEG